MYVCIYIRMYACIHTHTHTHTQTETETDTDTDTDTVTDTHTLKYIYDTYNMYRYIYTMKYI